MLSPMARSGLHDIASTHPLPQPGLALLRPHRPRVVYL